MREMSDSQGAERAVNQMPSLRVTRYKVASFGVFTSLAFLLIVATYPSFFLFDPSKQTDSVRFLILIASTIAWLLIALGPAVVFTLVALGRQKTIHLLPFIALAWPLMIAVNHLHLWVTTGQSHLGYLIQFPVFAITDLLTPLLLVILYLEFRYEDHYIHQRIARHSR